MKFSLEFDGTADELDQLLEKLQVIATSSVSNLHPPLTTNGRHRWVMSEQGKANIKAGIAAKKQSSTQ